MGFGDVLAGLAEASHAHETNLLEMAHQDRQAKAKLFADLANNPNLAPEQVDWLSRGALAHLTDPKEAKKYDVKDGNVMVPVNFLKSVSKPKPAEDAAQMPGLIPGQQGMDQVLQPPTPPPVMGQEMRSPTQPRSFEETMMMLAEAERIKGEQTAANTGAARAATLAAETNPKVLSAQIAADRAKNMVPVPPRFQGTLGQSTMPDTLRSETQAALDNAPTPPSMSEDQKNYAAYVADEAKRNTPVDKILSFDEWQTRDANRRRVAPSATIQIANATQAAANMPPDVSDALNRATMTMQPGRRLQVFSTVNQQFERGNHTGVRDTIKQAALENEPVAIRQTVQGRREVLKSLSDIETLLRDVPQNILVGTVEDVVRKLGTSTDPRYVRIGTRLNLLNQAYRRSMTGAQFSIPEAKEYASIFPGYSNTAPVNAAQIQGLREAFGANDSIFWDNKLGPGWSDFAPTAPTSNLGEVSTDELFKRLGSGQTPE